jgi:hypothetical protein
MAGRVTRKMARLSLVSIAAPARRVRKCQRNQRKERLATVMAKTMTREAVIAGNRFCSSRSGL